MISKEMKNLADAASRCGKSAEELDDYFRSISESTSDLSHRDWLAGLAMQSVMQTMKWNDIKALLEEQLHAESSGEKIREFIAFAAYAQADAMLRIKNK